MAVLARKEGPRAMRADPPCGLRAPMPDGRCEGTAPKVRGGWAPYLGWRPGSNACSGTHQRSGPLGCIALGGGAPVEADLPPLGCPLHAEDIGDRLGVADDDHLALRTGQRGVEPGRVERP